MKFNLVNDEELVFSVFGIVLTFVSVQHDLLAGLWHFMGLRYCVGHHFRAFSDHWVSGSLKGQCVHHCTCL